MKNKAQHGTMTSHSTISRRDFVREAGAETLGLGIANVNKIEVTRIEG